MAANGRSTTTGAGSRTATTIGGTTSRAEPIRPGCGTTSIATACGGGAIRWSARPRSSAGAVHLALGLLEPAFLGGADLARGDLLLLRLRPAAWPGGDDDAYGDEQQCSEKNQEGQGAKREARRFRLGP